METKEFFEVFPGLKLEGESGSLFQKVHVRKLVMSRDKTLLKVYIDSNYLIPKKQVYQVEQEIRQQIFGSVNLTVRLIEFYQLSSQYTPQTLLEDYKESILLELKNYSAIEYSMFSKAECQFAEGNIMQLTMEDSLVEHQKSQELKQILEKIFCERCGIPMEVRFFYRPVPQKSRFQEQKNTIIRQEIASVMSRLQQNTAAVNDTEEMPFITDEMLASAQAAQAESDNRSDKVQAGGQQTSLTSSDSQQQSKSLAANTEKKADKTRTASGKGSQNTSYKGRGGQGFERFHKRGFKRSDNPNVIYGRETDEEITPIEEVSELSGEVTIRGQIASLDAREIRGERSIVLFDITDFTDTIRAKIFVKNEILEELLGDLKKGKFIKLKGYPAMDSFEKELAIASVVGIEKSSEFRTKRMDYAPVKRVELHCHTKMSDMDGVSDAGSIIKRAIDWGHKALAITDHGVVQGFTEAFHALQKIEGDYKAEGKELDFKVLYGVEAYLVDDLKDAVTNCGNQSLTDTFVVFDLETTGFSPQKDKIIEIGAVRVEEGKITERFSQFVNPGIPIPFHIEELTHINDSMVMDCPGIEQVLPEFLEFCRDAVLVAHNADFDVSFIMENVKQLGLEREFTSLDTVALARVLLPSLNRFKLDTVAKALKIPLESHHRAVDDAGCTARIFEEFLKMLKERDLTSLEEVNGLCRASEDTIKKLPSYHAIILARNETGRRNLYTLISHSHIQYYHRRPRIPKSDFLAHREGLFIGSACEAGELYQAIIGGRSPQEIARLVDFYDYLEIQPTGNNEFMLRSDKYSYSTKEELEEINREIVSLGERFNKPVVGTCDVHFLDPEDEVYRRIIMAGKGFEDADQQAPLYLRTTEEMLAEFQYLGSRKAEEIVITNPNKIADMIEKMDPVRPDKCPPVIPDSDKTLRKICYDTAHSMYGPKLPEIVTERLERELNSIISNGFAVMYIIAQKLVWKSNEDGYLVGSRGSVGSSFVATMAGITEVNPLSPHYYCQKCHFSDFESEEVRQYVGGSGCDMPDRACPQCGEMLVKAGFDIPFETFLGFKGNKEPDIDLNFSGEYQNHAHDYTEVIFGKGQTFRAGTIGTLAEKTAYGYVRKYYEERGITKRSSEITRLAAGCEGIRRSTGQHPGGIIVLPHGEDINSFTPVQRPANDMTTKTITTHFDYHSIDHNLLKLDILGHDDPTMIRMLEDLTGLDAKTIPLDDQNVMSLFNNTEALNIKPEDIGGCQLGSLGIPEFGTEFVIQMLMDTKPKTFSDLVRISGLSHGTDVWLGNAQTLIEEGKATISTAICTRDDIMTYLINKGMDKELSFTIMESVRKGKGLKPDWESAMLESDVPEWYIWSCKKIKYMFPKAHAAAYVMMAFRIAYFKVYYPLAYYAAFFSIRAKAFDYEIMCRGQAVLEHYIEDYQSRGDSLTSKDKETVETMKLVQEMYARGYEFLPVDLFKAQAHRFRILDGKLMPAVDTIEGLGATAADAVVDAAKDGPFLSKDDFRNRTKVSKTAIDLMTKLGILADLPDSNQLSFFDCNSLYNL